MGLGKAEGVEKYFYDGSVSNLAEKLMILAEKFTPTGAVDDMGKLSAEIVEKFKWETLVPEFDTAIEALAD